MKEKEPLSQSQMIELLNNSIKRLEYLMNCSDEKGVRPSRIEIYHQQSPLPGEEVFKQSDELKFQSNQRLWNEIKTIEKKVDNILVEIDSIKTKNENEDSK